MSLQPETRLTRIHPERGLWKVSLDRDGTEVSRLWIFTKRMRIGTASIRIGGIGNVGTERDHRLKGYSSLVMRESTRLLSEQRIEMGFLFGIQDFYHRFGYDVAFAQTELQVPAEALACARPALRTRMMVRADAPAVRRVYNQLNAGRTGTIVRPPRWLYFAISAGFKRAGRTVVALDGRDRIVGYAMYDVRDERLVVSEIEARSHQAFQALADVLSKRARRRKARTAEIHVPIGHAFGSYCVSLGCSRQIRHPRNGGPMARVIDLPRLLDRMLPDLSRRVADSGFRDAVTFRTDLGDVCLGLENGQVRRLPEPPADAHSVVLPQSALMQLAMGYRCAADVSQDPGVRIPRRALAIVDSLFPGGYPYMAWPDRF